MLTRHKNRTTKRTQPIRKPHGRGGTVRQGTGISAAVERNLDLVLAQARAEYHSEVDCTWATQTAKLHTYLWLSVAIVSAECALFLRILDAAPAAPLPFAALGITLAAMLCAFAAFALGVDAMRNRHDHIRPLYGNDYSYAIEIAEFPGCSVRLREETIAALNTCITGQARTTDFLGRRMRRLSVCNLVSAFIGALGFLCHAVAQLFLQ